MNIKTTTNIDIPHIILRMLKKFNISTTNKPIDIISENFKDSRISIFLSSFLFVKRDIEYIRREINEKTIKKESTKNTAIFNQL